MIFDESNSWPWNPDGFRITRIVDANGVELPPDDVSINTRTGQVVRLKRDADGHLVLNESFTEVERETVYFKTPFSITFEHDSKRPPSNELLADGGGSDRCGIEAFLAVVAFPVVFALLWRLFSGLFVEG